VSLLASLDSRRRRFLTAWAMALVMGAAVFTLAGAAWRVLPHPQPLEELSYYPSGRFLEPATLGHAATAADLAWLRAVQYYGQHRATDNQFVRMGHVFDILTTLDPSFVPAYSFGAFALAQEGMNFPAAEQLMRKGLAANPTSGELAFQLGFLYYVRPGGRDLEHAADYFEQASRQADGPPQSARFAAFARQNSGDLMAAYELWANVERDSPNRYLREIAQREMARIREAVERGRREQAMRRLTTPIVLIKGRT
jgi:tetratricopeptide (TPR) repeat protein